ncbi:uncharacterized protein LOC130626129 [Hydractinia symbiolongicarpus]|uniref:uncharacterized protein LOC130626129 n=1 Tax=Hydractinia symbiolongicarpus TaxID=13093 RepID=UPI00254D6A35|nr:uncharacterized protein LOC130626129 [Hydractinia symbiolongicarpus]
MHYCRPRQNESTMFTLLIYASILLPVCYGVNNGGPTIRGTTLSNKGAVDRFCKLNPNKCPIWKYRNFTGTVNGNHSFKDSNTKGTNRFTLYVLEDMKRLRRNKKIISRDVIESKRRSRPGTFDARL